MAVSERVVIVTGAGQGIGQVYAQHFAKTGAKVVAVDIKGDNAKATAEGITKSGGDAIGVQTDIADEGAVKAMVAHAIERYGKVTALVNNAVFADQAPWDQVTAEMFTRALTVNVMGSFFCARAVTPSMRDQGKGHIVNIASGHFFKPGVNVIPYASSKGGIVGLTRALAHELGAFNITVNCVSPGLVRTAHAMEIHGDADYDARAQSRYIKRWEYPEDLVGAVDFFCSDGADFITGQLLSVDGGQNLN